MTTKTTKGKEGKRFKHQYRLFLVDLTCYDCETTKDWQRLVGELNAGFEIAHVSKDNGGDDGAIYFLLKKARTKFGYKLVITEDEGEWSYWNNLVVKLNKGFELVYRREDEGTMITILKKSNQ